MRKSIVITGLVVTLLLIAAVGGLYHFGRQKMIRDSVNQFNAAKSLYESSQWPEAQHIFSEILRKYPRSDVVPESYYYVALMLQSGGRFEEALETWRSRPKIEGDAHGIEVEYHIGRCLENLGRNDEATAQYESLAANSSAGDFASLAKSGLGRIAEAGRNLEKAHALYEEALADGSGEAADVAKKLLGELNLRMYFTPKEDEYKKVYLIRPGDSLVTIALRENVTVDQLCRLNGIPDPTRIRPGMRILIPQSDFSIHIDKSDFVLTLYNHDSFFKAYKVGLGKNDSTPAGDFVISDKIKDPTWWSPNGPIPPGDPHNELGTRWMALKPLTPGLGYDYGIHGTIDPSTIGWQSSNGCPRLYPKEAEELYMLVTKGTPVVIEE